MGALGMDADGIPISLAPECGETAEVALGGFLQQPARHPKGGLPILVLDEATAGLMKVEQMDPQPWLVDLNPETVKELLVQLNRGQTGRMDCGQTAPWRCGTTRGSGISWRWRGSRSRRRQGN